MSIFTEGKLISNLSHKIKNIFFMMIIYRNKRYVKHRYSKIQIFFLNEIIVLQPTKMFYVVRSKMRDFEELFV